MFLMWYDDSKHTTVGQRISEGLAAYKHRFGQDANVVLVNPTQICASTAVEIRPKLYIQRNLVYVGIE